VILIRIVGSGINLVIWTTLEDNIGIFAANLPALGFLHKHVKEKLAAVPALRYFRFSRSRSQMSEKDEDREMLPTIGGGNPRRTRGAFDSLLRSDHDQGFNADMESLRTHSREGSQSSQQGD
jgi:hypothetical protein